MPWTPKDAHRFSKKASPKKWSKIANAALGEYGDDATAIKIANAKAKPSSKKSPKKSSPKAGRR